MKKFIGLIGFILSVCVINFVPFSKFVDLGVSSGIITFLLMMIAAASLNSFAGSDDKKRPTKRLRKLARACRKIRLAGWLAIIEIPVLIVSFAKLDLGIVGGILTVFFPVFITSLKMISKSAAAAVHSRQVKITSWIAMLFLWWIPIVNLIIIYKINKTARRELIFESDREELEQAREERQICATKYPILLVHGIFFRDWQLVNYWGRIPAALKRNGARLFYGKQQSAQSVPDSAAELADRIREVLQETGAEKVNIIAHSKGGLDSRYAISCLGMEGCVATLTTVNTPHLGCDMVDYLLEKLPKFLVSFLTNKYNKIFHVLGDKKPDFIAGVSDLSAKRCAELNEQMPDSPNVSYRSIMSVMASARAAFFPLNIGYRLINKLNGANDGLVWERSAVHGSHTFIKPPKKKGISHGDVIDLMREDISGFDVREMYVDIVSGLKNEGY